MRVLQINSVCGIGSTGRIVTDIHSILKKQGHESYIAFGRGNTINSNKTIKIGNKYDNYIHVIKTRLFDKHGFGSKRATKEFIKNVIELEPDLIHLHNIHGYYINIEILFEYLKEANKPVIWTLHDCWPFTGHCAYFDYVGCECWKVDSNHQCVQKTSYPASLLFNNSRENYERKRKAFTGVKNLTIVTPSKWLAGLVKESFLNEYSVKVINNGIDLNLFKPKKSDFKKRYGLEKKFIILGVASTWDRRKGLKYFKDLSKRLNKNEIIVLVGVSKKQKEKLPNNIIGIQRTNNVQELVDIYSASDVFLNPTLEDNFPTTNLEALACGTPVITFNTGGSPESIDSTCGIVVSKGDTEMLYQALRSIYNNKIDKEKCILKSRSFDRNDKYSEYIKLYDRILLA